MHLLLVAASLGLLVVSASAYWTRRSGRYLFLLVAFLFFSLDQSVTLWQQLYFGDGLLTLPLGDIHVTHLLELVMAISFLAALLSPASLRREVPGNDQ